MKRFLQQLNEYIGALLLFATCALGTYAVVAYGADQRTDQRLIQLEQFANQQQSINESLVILSQNVAILLDRQNRPVASSDGGPGKLK